MSGLNRSLPNGGGEFPEFFSVALYDAVMFAVLVLHPADYRPSVPDAHVLVFIKGLIECFIEQRFGWFKPVTVSEGEY